MTFLQLPVRLTGVTLNTNMAKKLNGFCSKKSFTLYTIFLFEEWRCGCCPKTHSTSEAKHSKKFFFITTCLLVTCCTWLALMSRQGKKLPRFALVQNGLYILRSIFSSQKRNNNWNFKLSSFIGFLLNLAPFKCSSFIGMINTRVTCFFVFTQPFSN